VEIVHGCDKLLLIDGTVNVDSFTTQEMGVNTDESNNLYCCELGNKSASNGAYHFFNKRAGGSRFCKPAAGCWGR
jgi:hypothetical protein